MAELYKTLPRLVSFTEKRRDGYEKYLAVFACRSDGNRGSSVYAAFCMRVRMGRMGFLMTKWPRRRNR